MLLSETNISLLRQPILILNQEEDDSASESDRIRPDKESEGDETETKPEEEDLEGTEEEELPLVKENGDDSGEDWEEQL